MFDFNVFNSEKAANEGAVIHLTHPITGEPVYSDNNGKKPITITVKGNDSTVYQEALTQKLKQLRKNEQEDIESSFADEIKYAAELYADMTIDWQNISHEGKPLTVSRENAVLLYTTYKEVRQQVGDFIAKKENFIKG